MLGLEDGPVDLDEGRQGAVGAARAGAADRRSDVDRKGLNMPGGFSLTISAERMYRWSSG